LGRRTLNLKDFPSLEVETWTELVEIAKSTAALCLKEAKSSMNKKQRRMWVSQSLRALRVLSSVMKERDLELIQKEIHDLKQAHEEFQRKALKAIRSYTTIGANTRKELEYNRKSKAASRQYIEASPGKVVAIGV
jgi:hypothetical protein